MSTMPPTMVNNARDVMGPALVDSFIEYAPPREAHCVFRTTVAARIPR